MRKSIIVGVVAILVLGVAAIAYAAKPELVRQPGAWAVTAEHIDALNNCGTEGVDRLMAQYPESIHIIFPGGGYAEGREGPDGVRTLFEGFCAPWPAGLGGLEFTEVESWKVGNTINMIWEADACWLDEPYLGADAYETHANLMVAQVTTFDGAELKVNDGATCP